VKRCRTARNGWHLVGKRSSPDRLRFVPRVKVQKGVELPATPLRSRQERCRHPQPRPYRFFRPLAQAGRPGVLGADPRDPGNTRFGRGHAAGQRTVCSGAMRLKHVLGQIQSDDASFSHGRSHPWRCFNTRHNGTSMPPGGVHHPIGYHRRSPQAEIQWCVDSAHHQVADLWLADDALATVR
jgi:hypothetical protein